MKRLINTITEFSKSAKGKKILSTVAVTFIVCLFFIWLIVGMYLYLEDDDRDLFVPMLMLYLVFPIQTIVFAAKKIYVIYTKGFEDTMADDSHGNE